MGTLVTLYGIFGEIQKEGYQCISSSSNLTETRPSGGFQDLHKETAKILLFLQNDYHIFANDWDATKFRFKITGQF